jgi:hypothetical protein
VKLEGAGVVAMRCSPASRTWQAKGAKSRHIAPYKMPLFVLFRKRDTHFLPSGP